jgi:hypothetical protein
MVKKKSSKKNYSMFLERPKNKLPRGASFEDDGFTEDD